MKGGTSVSKVGAASRSARGKDDRPKADLVLRDDGFDANSFSCPRCGSREWSPGSYHYEVGRREVTYTCWHESHGGRRCGFRVRTVEDVPELIWVAPNQQWLIYGTEPRLSPDPENPHSTVAAVEISDGWNAGEVVVTAGGDIRYDSWALYDTPKYVREKAESILNRRHRELIGSKSAGGHRWVVIPFRPGRYTIVSGDAVPYDTKREAMDAAKAMFLSMSESDREGGAGVTVGETDRWDGTQNFSYNHVYEFSYREHSDLRPRTESRSARSRSAGRAPKAKSVRSAVDIERLAADMATWMDDHDHYAFADAHGSWEDAYAEVLRGLSDASYVRGAIRTLEGIGVIDHDRDLESRRRDILGRLRRLENPKGSESKRGGRR